MCGGGINSGTMRGDSGGPLMIVKDNKWVLSGITSRGLLFLDTRDNETISDRGVYTKVSHYCDFIQDNTNNEAKCLD